MPGDSVTATVAVHEASLASAALVEDPFLRQGQGSAFVSRPNELVVLVLSPAGLGAIHSKAVQLVERGFHSILVSVKPLPKLEADATKTLLKARRYVENWAGFLKICDVPQESAGLLKTVGFDQDLDPTLPREAGVEFCRRVMKGESPASAAAHASSMAVSPLTTGSSDLLASGVLDSEDEITPVVSPPGTNPLASRSNDSVPAGQLPSVDVAELVVPSEDLPRLRRQLEGIVARGKRYVTMRLSFKKRMRSEDVTLLTEARDILTNAGGQLALASLQQDVATWLRMLDYDREFLIFDDVDAAEIAHRKHAAGTKVAPRAAASPAAPVAPEAPFAIVGRPGSSVLVRPRATVGRAQAARTQAGASVIELTRATLGQLVAEVERRTAEGARDIVVDLKALEGLRGERLETLSESEALARLKGARLVYSRVGRELRAFIKLVGLEGKLPLHDDEDSALLSLAKERHALGAFEELELALTRGPVREPARTDAVARPTASFGKPAAPVPPTKLAPAKLDSIKGTAATAKPVDPETTMLDLEFDVPDEQEEKPLSPEEAQLHFAHEKAKSDATKLGAELTTVKAKLKEAEANKLRLEKRVSDLETAARKNESRIQELNSGAAATTAVKAEADRKAAELEKKAAEHLAQRDQARGQAEKAGFEAARLATELEILKTEHKALTSNAAATADEKAAQTISNLEARFREADYSRNEAVRIAQSANEARKRLESKLEELEAAQGSAKKDEAKIRELEAAHKRLEDYVQSVKSERDEATGRAAELERVQEELEAKLQKAESESSRLRTSLDPAKAAAERVQELEKSNADLQARARELEARVQSAERQAQDAERKAVEAAANAANAAKSAPAAKSGAVDPELAAKNQRLEREKAEILLESKREIERLTREQEVLREELESAGEMIERLGKELELT